MEAASYTAADTGPRTVGGWGAVGGWGTADELWVDGS